jgi:hypothetical protein
MALVADEYEILPTEEEMETGTNQHKSQQRSHKTSSSERLTIHFLYTFTSHSSITKYYRTESGTFSHLLGRLSHLF